MSEAKSLLLGAQNGKYLKKACKTQQNDLKKLKKLGVQTLELAGWAPLSRCPQEIWSSGTWNWLAELS